MFEGGTKMSKRTIMLGGYEGTLPRKNIAKLHSNICDFSVFWNTFKISCLKFVGLRNHNI